MAGKKKAKAEEPKAPESKPVAPVSTDETKTVYRADMGESLPPQKHPGVE